MPTSRKAITFSMPPELAEQVQQLLKEEGRTMSEFLREAIRLYMEEREWLRRERRQRAEARRNRPGMSKEDAPMNQNTDYTPVALYARVSSDRQDVDLSIAAQLRALRDYAQKNGYIVFREYVDEAESGRIADRPEFRKMIDAATKPSAPFREILVWKFSRFTRKREHAVAFKSMLRRKGVRVVSITEHADDTPTGKLMEAIIESVDEFYSENLAQEVTRGMRESASRGFWVTSYAPFGYNRVMVQDGPKKRPTLEPDPDASRVVKRIFDLAEAGNGMTDITRTLNGEGILSPKGKLWGKTSVHTILINESYTGTLVWGVNAKDNAEPVRVEKAFPAIVTKAQFSRVKKLMHSRAPKMSHPRRVGSTYLLSGLVKCKTCNRALSGQDAKSGQFAYYVCQSIMKRGKDACDTPRLNARRFEELVVEKIRSNILTEGSITELVKVVDEEMDGIAQDQRKRLRIIEDELEDVKRRLGRIWNAIETSDLDMADASDRIKEHRERKERLEDAAADARAILSERRAHLDDVKTISAYAKDMRDFLNESELTERRAFIESFVKEIIVMPGDALMRYTVPMPDDSLIPGRATEKVALNGSVLSTRTRWWASCTETSTGSFKANFSIAFPGIRLSLGMGTVYLRRASPGMTTISLYERLDEGLALGQFAVLQEVSHFLGVGLDGVHVVQDRPELGQNLPGRRRLVLKEFLPVPEFPDVVSSVGHIKIVGLPDEVPDAAKVPLHILKFRVYGLQPLVLLGGHSIHLLVHGLHQVADVSLGENVGANLFDDQVLESSSVEPRGVAGSAALLHEGLTDVIWKTCRSRRTGRSVHACRPCT